MKKFLLALGIFMMSGLFGSPLFAQPGLGVDLVSRYVWRGLQTDGSPHIQPYLSYTKSNLEAGIWGSYPVSSGDEGVEEIDLYAKYTIPMGEAELTASIYDYHYPNAGVEFFDFNDGEGAHTIELNLFYDGAINLFGAVNVYNDEDNSLYAEIGYDREFEDVSVEIFAGASLTESPGWYGNEDLAFINVGVTGSKEIKITEQFSMPAFASLIVNADIERAMFVFGVSF